MKLLTAFIFLYYSLYKLVFCCFYISIFLEHNRTIIIMKLCLYWYVINIYGPICLSYIVYLFNSLVYLFFIFFFLFIYKLNY